MKRIISVFMAAILLVSMFTFGTISASAAAASPSFGTATGSITRCMLMIVTTILAQ